MTPEQIQSDATKIFNALNDDKLVLTAGKSIDAVRVKDGKLIVYSFGDSKCCSFDASNYEVAVYEKKEILHAAPVETATK